MARTTRTPFITTGSLLAILAAAGCGSGAGGGVGNMGGAAEENLGTVVLTLTQAPVANTCKPQLAFTEGQP